MKTFTSLGCDPTNPENSTLRSWRVAPALRRFRQACLVRPQHAVDSGGEAEPRLLATGELRPAGLGQLVVLAATAVRLTPERFQELVPLQPVQRRVERALLHLEGSPRPPGHG